MMKSDHGMTNLANRIHSGNAVVRQLEDFNWEDWFTTQQSGNVRVGGFEDILGGEFSEFFRRIFGGMQDIRTPSRGRASVQQNQRSELPSYQQEVTISLNEAYQGTTRKLEVDGRRLEVKIPPGAKTGTKVRVKNTIPTGISDQKGDLFLVIRLAEDHRFEVKGNDLHIDIPIDLYTAVLGGEVTVQTLSGNVVLTIPAGVQPGQTIRLAGRGMPRLNAPSNMGDLFAHIKVKIPNNLTPRQKELFQELKRS